MIESPEVLVMVGRKVRDAEEAAALLEAAEASGMTRADWARHHGIDARSLNAWRLNLGRPEPEVGSVRLVELVGPVVASGASLVVRCGPFSVEVGEGADDDVLQRVLRAMASC